MKDFDSAQKKEHFCRINNIIPDCTSVVFKEYFVENCISS